MRLTKQEYEKRIKLIAPQIAEILAHGQSVELAESRSGLKLFAVTRSHKVMNFKSEVSADGEK